MDVAPTTRRASARDPIRRAQFSRGINLEDLPMHAGTKTESVTNIAEFSSLPKSLPSSDDVARNKNNRDAAIATGEIRLPNWATLESSFFDSIPSTDLFANDSASRRPERLF